MSYLIALGLAAQTLVIAILWRRVSTIKEQIKEHAIEVLVEATEDEEAFFDRVDRL